MNTIQIISIEGNIGSGKSTVVNSLKEFYKENGKSIIYFLEEPVDEWVEIKDTSGKNIIEKFYENKERYSFSFQMMSYISRLAMLKRAIKYCNENGYKIIVCERSLQTDKNVFCQMLYDTMQIEEVEFQIYNKWFYEFISEIPKIYYIYIHTNPQVAYERVIKRQRKGETINLEYLETCSNYHDIWLREDEKSTILIDGNHNTDVVFNKVNIIITICYEKILLLL